MPSYDQNRDLSAGAILKKQHSTGRLINGVDYTPLENNTLAKNNTRYKYIPKKQKWFKSKYKKWRHKKTITLVGLGLP